MTISHLQNKLYSERFSNRDVEILRKNDIPPSAANKFDSRFKGKDIVKILETELGYSEVNKYDERFSNYDVVEVLLPNSCFPEIANKYKNINADEILILRKMGISCDDVNSYDTIYGFVIPVFLKLGLTPEFFNQSPWIRKEKYLKIATRLISETNYFNILKEIDFSNGKLLGTGASGLVCLVDGSAWKFSDNLNAEIENLKKLSNIENIVQLHSGLIKSSGSAKERRLLYPTSMYGTNPDILAIEIEYISGNTIENLVKSKKIFSSDEILRYSSNILRGLDYMRSCGIYHHRDIRPANIMIDELNNRAVIIDLGIATCDEFAYPENNYRYGSPRNQPANDLISLGQVMYFMNTGKHLFDESNTMFSSFSELKDLIFDERERVYNDKSNTLLEKKINILRENICDTNLAITIEHCLKSKYIDEDYFKIRELLLR